MKVRTEARREAIVDAARRLFLELGYERATMGELTRRLGGSKATLYGYFPSKKDLFVAVVEEMGAHHMTAAADELHLLAATGVAAGLQRFAERMLTLLTQDEALALQRMILGEAGRSEVGEILIELGPHRTLSALSAALQAAMDRGELPQAPAQILAMQFMALVQAEIALRLFQQRPPPLDAAALQAMATRAMRVFLGGCRALAG